MQKIFSSLKKWLLLGFLILICISLLYLDIPSYLTFKTIQSYQSVAQSWTHAHYFSAVTIYIFAFTFLIACAIPCATILTLLGGFLFGIAAFFYAVMATTLGGLILFFAVRTSIGHWIAKRTSGKIKIMEYGFQQNAFQFLLLMRLVPVFPCWLSNVSAGALNVPVRTFIIATILGIIPATFVFTLLGKGLDKFFSANQPPNYSIFLTPAVFFPLLGLIILAFIPVIYKVIKKLIR